MSTEILAPVSNNPENYPLVFIKVEPRSNPECSWAGYSPLDNCNFLKEATNAVWHLGSYTPAIFSTAPIWEQFFGSSCDTFAADTGALLSHASYNSTGQVTSTHSYNDFVPFGGFTL